MAFGQDYAENVGSYEAGRIMFLQPDALSAGYKIIKPTLEHPTMLRILPAVDEQGTILPYRQRSSSSAFGTFTDWMCSLKVFSGGVTSFVSFICQMPAEGNLQLVQRASVISPPDRLYARIKQLSDSTGHAADGTPFSNWHTLLKGKAGRGAPLSRPKLFAFMHCIRAYHNNVNYIQSQPLSANVKFVVALSESARRSLEALLNAEAPGWRERGIDPDSVDRFAVGDWLGSTPRQEGAQVVVDGRYLLIKFRGAAVADRMDQAALSMSINQPIESTGRSNTASSGFDSNQYECTLGHPQPVPVAWIRECYRPWERTLQLMTPDRQVELLADAGFTRAMLLAAFEDTDWLPNSIRHGAMISTPPAGVPLGSMPGMPMANAPGYGLPASTPPGHAVPVTPWGGPPAWPTQPVSPPMVGPRIPAATGSPADQAINAMSGMFDQSLAAAQAPPSPGPNYGTPVPAPVGTANPTSPTPSVPGQTPPTAFSPSVPLGAPPTPFQIGAPTAPAPTGQPGYVQPTGDPMAATQAAQEELRKMQQLRSSLVPPPDSTPTA